jgi:hypothetical protein
MVSVGIHATQEEIVALQSKLLSFVEMDHLLPHLLGMDLVVPPDFANQV